MNGDVETAKARTHRVFWGGLELPLAVIIVATLTLWYKTSASTNVDVQLPPADSREEAAALESSYWFLQLVDSGRTAETWSEVAPFLQTPGASAMWVGMISGFRGAAGSVLGRKLSSSIYTESLEDAPPGRYFIFDFDTDFENLRAVERTVAVFDNGDWRIAGYHYSQSYHIP